MSLQSSMAVMKAKLSGNLPALQALAMQGDFEAVAALKELNDQKAYAQGMANETAMGQGDALPVLEQLVGQLDQPQSGIAAYAGGGRAFADGGSARVGFSWENDPSIPKLQAWNYAAQARRGEVGGPVTQRDVWLAQNPQSAAYDDTTMQELGDALTSGWNRLRGMFNTSGPYRNEGSNYPAPQVAAYPDQVQTRNGGAANKATVRKPSYTGIAAAAAPAPKDPDAGMPVVKATPLPPAQSLGDQELTTLLEQLTPLQKERDALRAKSREQLEAAYNEKVKTLTPSKFDRVMEFLAGVSAKGGSSAAQALGAGALAMHGKDKERQLKLASAKETYAKADLLEQEAALKDHENGVMGAYKLRQEAAKLRAELEGKAATKDLNTAQAEFYRGAKADQARAAAAASKARASGLGAAKGAKGIDPVKRARLIAQEADAMARAEGKDISVMTPTDRKVLSDKATVLVDQRLGAYNGATAASPAAPSSGVKFLGFE